MAELMRLSFKQVSAIAHPEYFRAGRPCGHPNRVPDEHWTDTSKVGGDELVDRLEGLVDRQRAGDLIRDVSLVPEDDIAVQKAEIRRLLGKIERVEALAADYAVDDSYPHPGTEVADEIRRALSGELDTRGARDEPEGGSPCRT